MFSILTSFLENFFFASVKIVLTLSEFNSVHISSKKSLFIYLFIDLLELALLMHLFQFSSLPYHIQTARKTEHKYFP